MKYVEQYGTAREATDYNIIRRMLFENWTNKATHTHTHTHTFQVRNTFHCDNGYANAPQNYVTPTLSY